EHLGNVELTGPARCAFCAGDDQDGAGYAAAMLRVAGFDDVAGLGINAAPAGDFAAADQQRSAGLAANQGSSSKSEGAHAVHLPVMAASTQAAVSPKRPSMPMICGK